jgi:hypothetical protein
VRSEYQPERKRKNGSTVFIPKYQENGNIRDKSGPRVLVEEPYYRTDLGKFRGKAGSRFSVYD